MPSSLQTLPTVQVFGYVYNPLTGIPVPLGTPVSLTWKVALGSVANPLVNIIPASQTVFTDANGYWTVNVVPPDKLSPANSTYHVTDSYNSFDIGNFTLAGMPVGGYQDLNIRVSPAPAVLPPGPQTVGALTVTGLLTAQAGLTVTGVTTIQSLTASGLITGSAGLTISAGGAAITGNTTITGTLTSSGALTVQAGGATVTGNSTVTGTLTVSAGLTVNAGGAAITGNSTVTGTLTVSAGLTVNAGGATITGNSTVTGTLTVSGLVTAQAGLTVSAADLILSGLSSQRIQLTDASGTPNKWLRASGGNFQVIDSAFVNTLLSLTNAGVMSLLNSLSMPPSVGGAVPTTNYGTVPVKIDDQLLGASAASITFVNPLPTVFRHLLIEWYARGDTGAATTTMLVRFNNISTATYDREYLRSFGGAALSNTEELGQTSIFLGFIPANSATAAYFGAGEAKVKYYNQTTGEKVLIGHHFGSFADTTGNQEMDVVAGKWRTTNAAITRIDLFPAAGNFAAGSLFTLWGIP